MSRKAGLAIILSAPVLLAPALGPAAAPVRVSFGDHAAFSRLAVRPGGVAVTGSIDRPRCALVVEGAGAAWRGDLSTAARLPSRRLGEARVAADGRLVVPVPCGAELRERRENGQLLFDVTAGPAGVFHLPPPPPRHPSAAPEPPLAVASAGPTAAGGTGGGTLAADIRAMVKRAAAAVDGLQAASHFPPPPGNEGAMAALLAAQVVAPTPAGLPVTEVALPPALSGVPPLDPLAWRASGYVAGRQALMAEGDGEAALIDAARFHLAWGQWSEARAAAGAAMALAGGGRHEARLLAEAAALAGGLSVPAEPITAAGPKDHPDWAPFAVVSWLATGKPDVDRDDIARGLDRVQAYGPELEAALLPGLTEAAIRSLDGDAARAALARLERMAAEGRVDPAALGYLRGLLALAQRRGDEAAAAFAEAGRRTGPWAARARLQAIDDDRRTGRADPGQAAMALDRLVADWRGDETERRAQRLRLDLATAARDADREVSALAALIRLAGPDEDASALGVRLQAALDSAYDRAEHGDLPLPTMVWLHARYGLRGDPATASVRTIRYARILQASGLTLAARDVLSEPAAQKVAEAQLLLARSDLDRGDYQRAMQTLAGADSGAAAPLRAQALAGLDDRTAALAAIAGRQDADALRVKAGILFSAGAWAEAQAGFAAAEAAGAPLTRAERLRWLAAALEAGDAKAADAIGGRLDGDVSRLLAGLRPGGVSITADRKAGLAALQDAGRVVDSFEAIFGRDGAAGGQAASGNGKGGTT